ncbi:MAG: hypothetical protein KAV41_01850 [Candidatus Pacebacteria bacterium]|nr:hypothetical protein [Candidatus Paceibacterota bacterium]
MKKESLKVTFSEMSEILKPEQERPWVPKIRVEKKIKFCCPICEGTEYEEVEKSNGIIGPGGHVWADYYFCAGCTAMFKDPVLFTKK